jgi:hypothetical protein
MKLVEVKKGSADIRRGNVMLAIEGEESIVMKTVSGLKSLGYGHNFSDCVEESEDGVGIVAFFVVDRCDVSEFKASYKISKKFARIS